MPGMQALHLSQLRVWNVRKMKMKKFACLSLAFLLIFSLTSCGKQARQVELYVFAAASLTETMDEIIEDYKTVAPDVTVIPTYDSSGTLLKQIQEGAACDLFLSAAQKQMDTLGDAGSLQSDTRVDLLENQVVLVVPEGGPAGIRSFDELCGALEAGTVLLAIGNRDVPVGQYTQSIFAYYGLDEASLAAAGTLTYGSNAKEVTAQVSEGSVDCGIVYATDAFSAGLEIVDTATEEMCGPVVYPAAVMKDTAHPDEALDFLTWLGAAGGGMPVFESAGFTGIGR